MRTFGACGGVRTHPMHPPWLRAWFGFRKNHSTSLALIHLINKISSAIDRHEITAGVLSDLSKTFDTRDHEILFAKLEHYGIRDVALRWIKSYSLMKLAPQSKL